MTKRKTTVTPIVDQEDADIQRETAANPDHPEATDDELATARPLAEMFPVLAARINKGGRPRATNPRQRVTLRLDPDVLDKF